MNNLTADKHTLIKMGFKESTAVRVIQQAKQLMVTQGYEFYANKRLGIVPAIAVEQIIGITLPQEEIEEV